MRYLQAIARQIGNFVLPSRCAGCSAIVTQAHSFCLSCWTKLQFLGDSGCDRCGIPLPVQDLTCAECLAKPPAHDGVLSAIIYGEVARSVVTRFKYGRRTGLARVMANGMSRHLQDKPDALLIPVPLHRWRIWQRGFNQSLLIARHLAKTHALKVEPQIILRTKKTPSLAGMRRHERAKTVRGAFALNPKSQNRLAGRHIILIDDVCTTGATANACAKVLKTGGAAKVEILCWARATKDDVLEGPLEFSP